MRSPAMRLTPMTTALVFIHSASTPPDGAGTSTTAHETTPADALVDLPPDVGVEMPVERAGMLSIPAGTFLRGCDAEAAARRLAAIVGIEVLAATGEARALAEALLVAAAMPRKAAVDAAHVAIAALNGMEFLVTWNCAHIANAVMRPRIEQVCRNAGFEPPTICTPDELRVGEDT